MGQDLLGHVELEEGKLVFNVVLPPALSFIEPIISGAIKQSGQKLIAGPDA
jgi:hypothetical protein